jgi:hypothetical protein
MNSQAGDIDACHPFRRCLENAGDVKRPGPPPCEDPLIDKLAGILKIVTGSTVNME